MPLRFNSKTWVAAALVLLGLAMPAWATKLVDVRPVDDEYLMVYWQDGRVEWGEDKPAPPSPTDKPGGKDKGDIARIFGKALDTAVAANGASYTITSSDDPNYSGGVHPIAASRQMKVNGTAWKWPEPILTFEHTVFLKLPQKLQQGKHYSLAIAPATNSDALDKDFAFDVFNSVSEAVHVNIIGYDPQLTAMKSADLYMWLGDGGTRDYSEYVGRDVILYNVQTAEKTPVGKVKFWQKKGPDFGNRDLIASDVWNCDFSAFTGTGTYRLVVDGVGCSPDFALRRDVYYEPFKTSIRGFFYMRIGASKEIVPTPRQPRFIPGKDPANFKVYRTTFGPWHPDWRKRRGDVWDWRDWSQYNEPGNPTNPNAWGGHSDAGDWDRHIGHISIIWDMLLPYFLSNGKIADDNCQIPESGNGLPDIMDEAQYEVDFWLRVRDGKGGYGSGLNNPSDDDTVMYQAAAAPYAAWASAANAAMYADCCRIAGKTDLMNQYRDAAIEAWKVANNQGLDDSYGLGNGSARGRDMKMMAAAFLYNVTGDRAYEDAMAAESVAKGSTTTPAPRNRGMYAQYWGMAAYLMCAKEKWRPIHHPELLANMKAAIVREAMTKNVANSNKWPSRRSSNNDFGWFQTTQEVQAACIAHAVSTDPAEKEAMLRAMLLEADWGLGRNPMNMVQMTGLGSRHVEDVYTSGWDDGYPGVHPGHTPYLNAEPWGRDFMANPKWYADKGYPAWPQWPQVAAYWRARYCYANVEFTPQQTMRGKMCLLGYLYSLGEEHKADAAKKPESPKPQ